MRKGLVLGYKLINSYLMTIDFCKIYANCVNVDDYWQTLKRVLDELIRNFVPHVSKKNINLVG